MASDSVRQLFICSMVLVQFADPSILTEGRREKLLQKWLSQYILCLAVENSGFSPAVLVVLKGSLILVL